MQRRQFLRAIVAATLAMGSSPALAFFGSPRLTEEQKALLEGLLILDAHAHPDSYKFGTRSRDNASSLEAIRELGMAACSFAALGDTVAATRGHTTGTDYQLTKVQLDFWMDGLVKSGQGKACQEGIGHPEIDGPRLRAGGNLFHRGGRCAIREPRPGKRFPFLRSENDHPCASGKQ